MAVYIECDICGIRELVNKDGRYYKIRPYWLTPVSILSAIPEHIDIKNQLIAVSICESCEKSFNKKIKEFNDENINWFHILVDSTKEDITGKKKGKK